MRETRRRTSGLPRLSNRRRSGLSIWSYTLRNAGAILLVSVPAIIITSHASGCQVSVSCWPMVPALFQISQAGADGDDRATLQHGGGLIAWANGIVTGDKATSGVAAVAVEGASLTRAAVMAADDITTTTRPPPTRCAPSSAR
jgi:hypothetical protein